MHVKVDGETHCTKLRQGETVGAQKAVDRRNDNEAWWPQLMLVQLHDADQTSWRARLQQARVLALGKRPRRFIIYTRSYKQLGLGTKAELLKVRPTPPARTHPETCLAIAARCAVNPTSI